MFFFLFCLSLQIEDFNWNLRIFVDVLNTHQLKVNVANTTTFDLLDKIVDKIQDLCVNMEEIETGKNDAIMCKYDENKFELKRTMFCRICKVIGFLLFIFKKGKIEKFGNILR